jgi:hypothetical protein
MRCWPWSARWNSSAATAGSLLHVYVDVAAVDAAGAALRYPGIVAHLRACGPCGQDFEGLLAVVREPGP